LTAKFVAERDHTTRQRTPLLTAVGEGLGVRVFEGLGMWVYVVEESGARAYCRRETRSKGKPLTSPLVRYDAASNV
jgi:hypothetical protein